MQPGNRGIEVLNRKATGMEGLIRFCMVKLECCTHPFWRIAAMYPPFGPTITRQSGLISTVKVNRSVCRLSSLLDECGVLVQLIGPVVSASRFDFRC